jgi:hypothetical protein
MCKPPCCETSSGGGIPAPLAALGLFIVCAAIAGPVMAVVHAVDMAIPYILGGLGILAVAGTVGTVLLVVRGTPPNPEFASKTNRQRLQRPVPEDVPASLNWSAQVLAIGGKPVTAPAQTVRQPTHAR